MIRLKGAHRGDRALVIFGGPSLLAQRFDFARLNQRGFVTFLETKALTPGLVATGFVPDYHLMLFPEKSKDNSLQHFIYRSFLAGYRIEPLLARKYHGVVADMRARFDQLFEGWRPHRGAHKKYRWRPDVFLPDSSYDVLSRVPKTRVIVDRELLSHYFPDFAYGDRAFYYAQAPSGSQFDADKYFNPTEEDGLLRIRSGDTFLNSAAIALYPLLNYMGFRDVYFAGMDMSLLGSLEYSAPHTFKSMAHFWWFLRRNGHVFNGNYIANGWLFARPTSEFNDVRMLWEQSPMRFTRVYEPWRYSWPVPGIRTITFDQLEKE